MLSRGLAAAEVGLARKTLVEMPGFLRVGGVQSLSATPECRRGVEWWSSVDVDPPQFKALIVIVISDDAIPLLCKSAIVIWGAASGSPSNYQKPRQPLEDDSIRLPAPEGKPPHGGSEPAVLRASRTASRFVSPLAQSVIPLLAFAQLSYSLHSHPSVPLLSSSDIITINMKLIATLLLLAAISTAFIIPDEHLTEEIASQSVKNSQTFLDRLHGDVENVWSGVEETFKDSVAFSGNALDNAINAINAATEAGKKAQSSFECHMSMTKFDMQGFLDSAVEAVEDVDVFQKGDKDKKPHHPPHRRPPHHHDPHKHHLNQTVYQLIASSKYTTKLAELINRYPDLVETLNGTAANYTVFAPTDKAFEKIPKGHKKVSKELVNKILAYHVSPDFYPVGRVFLTHTIPTALHEDSLGGEPQRLRVGFGLGKGLNINFYSRIVAINIFGTNGVIHGVDSILLPPPPALKIIELFPGEFSTLQLGLQKTGLFDAIAASHHEGGTLFAPSNFAFQKLGPKINAFLFSKYGEKYLKALLKYHVVANHTLYSDAFYKEKGAELKVVDEIDMEGIPKGFFHVDLPTLLDDKSLSIDVARYGGLITIKINGFSSVAVQDGIAKDGVIHVVSSILIPPKTPGGAQYAGEEMTVEEFKGRFDAYVEELTFNQGFCCANSDSAIEIAVSNSKLEIQSAASISGNSRKGRYFSRIEASSSAAERARLSHCASVLNSAWRECFKVVGTQAWRPFFSEYQHRRQYSTPPPPPPDASPAAEAPRPKDLRSQFASSAAQQPFRQPKQKRSLRPYIYATFFLLIGLTAGQYTRLVVAPPPLPTAGSKEDQLMVDYLQSKAEKLPVVHSLSTDPNWVSYESYSSVPEEARGARLTTGPLAGARALGGFQRVFYNKDSGEAVTIIWFGGAIAGWPGVVHGGVIATVVDEVLGRCAVRKFPAQTGVTANLELKYLKPIITNSFYVIRAVPIAEGYTERKGWVNGRVETLEGNVCVEAKGLFVVPKKIKLKPIVENY
ncbi:hypothetical protein G7Y89_g415 [Cudoniella acicularis]|uniref:FAS1 domain-containing protein n=1 Tax=Cudoniella acicularis TaxID=354080 RepID=A0A8H4RX71_9HELO|nr:hypothetical protein G7Y89_g415 [Cudoniella acicularis]